MSCGKCRVRVRSNEASAPRRSASPDPAEPADDGVVAVVEERGDAGVEAGDPAHLLVAEREVEHVDVLRHPLGADGLGNDDDLALDQPAQHHLGDRLAVLAADGAEHRVAEEVVPAFGEGTPGLELDAALAHQLLVGGTLVGASGTFLTLLMAKAMGRSVANILFGALKGGSTLGAGEASDRPVKSAGPEDVGILLAYAERVIAPLA